MNIFLIFQNRIQNKEYEKIVTNKLMFMNKLRMNCRNTSQMRDLKTNDSLEEVLSMLLYLLLD